MNVFGVDGGGNMSQWTTLDKSRQEKRIWLPEEILDFCGRKV